MRLLKISTGDLACFVGCTRSAITAFIQGQTEQTRYLPRIAEGLRTTVEYLVGANPDPGSGNWLGALNRSDMALAESVSGMSRADLSLFQALVEAFEVRAHQNHTIHDAHASSTMQKENDPPSGSSLAERIGSEMRKKGMSQISLARRVGCSGAAMSNILNGKVQQTRLLPRIADALQVPVSDLYGDPKHLSGMTLSKEQSDLVLRLRSLPPSDRLTLRRTAVIFARSFGRGT